MTPTPPENLISHCFRLWTWSLIIWEGLVFWFLKNELFCVGWYPPIPAAFDEIPPVWNRLVFFKSVLDTQNVVYIKNVQTKLLEVKKVKVGCFLVGQGTKRAENANIWPKMTKNAHFGPNLAVFGPNILIFMGVSESFGTNITENHLDNLSTLFFGQALDQMGQKCTYLAKNASFRPNLVAFGPKIHILRGWSKTLSILISGNQWDTFFVLKRLTGAAEIGR